jgi:SAM-dependent methyltransferase
MLKKYRLPDLDEPSTSVEHRKLILQKPFLRKWYERWYRNFIRETGENGGKLLELGSGGGFMKTLFPQVITSDIMAVPGVDRIIDAEKLPFEEGELGGIFMLNVFHHVPDPGIFLKEAERVLMPGGKIFMVEPANTFFSRFIYKKFHHEPFNEKGERTIRRGNPLSHSNQAMAYIYFERDRKLFDQRYPALKIKRISYHTPLLYLLSGGVSRSAFLPGFTYPIILFVEKLLSPLASGLSLFCTVVIEKKSNAL